MAFCFDTVAYYIRGLDGWLIVYRSITLVDFQLDAQILICLYIIHLLKSSTCFEHYPAYLQEVYVVIVYMQTLVSSQLTFYRVMIPEAAYIQLRRRPPEDEQGNA